jgi:hypothetical protein
MNETDKALQNAQPYEPSIEEQEIRTQAKGYKIMKVVDAIKMDMPKPPMIVEDISNEKGSALLVAEDNVGKSMMANQLGICIATGQSFLGYQVPKPRRVLMVQHEMENGEQTSRFMKQLSNNEHMDLLSENLEMQLIQETDNLAITDQMEMLDITFENNPHIEVCVFDNIGMSTNVEMTKPDVIRNELKRLKTLSRKHDVAFILLAHHNKVEWWKVLDLKKSHIQGGKPVSDWADNIIQLHTSSLNPELILMKLTKVRSIHNDEGVTSKDLPQGVWFNKNKDLLFTDRFTLNNWQMHFKALDKYEKESEFVKELATYPQPFNRNDALNVGDKMEISIPTIDRWLKKLVKPMGWLIKTSHGEWRVNQEVLDYIQIAEE